MQVTVYIPRDLEGRLVELSEANNESIQKVLLGPWLGGKMSPSIEGILARIEGKLDRVMGYSVGGSPGAEKRAEEAGKFFNQYSKDVQLGRGKK